MAFRKSELSVAAFSVLLLASCGGGGGGGSSDSDSSTASEDENGNTNISVSLDVLNGTDSAVLYQLGSSDYSSIAFSSENASLEAGADGYLVLRFRPEMLSDPDFLVKDETVHYSASSSSRSIQGYITISYGRDPLINHQWYIRNTTADDTADAGSDRIDGFFYKVWRRAVHGSGALVAVLDDGLEIKHPDLSANIGSGSYNYEYLGYKNLGWDIPNGMTETDPTPLSSGDAHGTNVAGIIAASAANGTGISGIAPEARVIGFNVMSSLLTSVGQNAARLDAYSKIRTQGNVDVINESFGTYDGSFYTDDTMSSLMKALYDSGTVRVSAAGNYFAPDEYLNAISTSEALEYQECSLLGTNCVWTQNGPGDYLPWVIKAGAVGFSGAHASYSSAGTNLLVSGFGGDMSGPYIYSTDRTTCSAGYNKTSSDEDTSCSYYDGFTGTSAAAPTVTGLVALLRGQYPSLSPSQVRWILAKSSRNDSALPGLSYSPVYSGDILVDEGWTENGAGLRFSRRYGFGVIDAPAALDAADGCAGDAECSARSGTPGQYTIVLSCTKADAVSDDASTADVYAGTYDSARDTYIVGYGFDQSHDVSSHLDNKDQHYVCTGKEMLDSSDQPVSGSFTLDSVLLSVDDFSFRSRDAGLLSVCGSRALEHQTPMTGDDTVDYINTVARSKLGLAVRTPGSTYSVLKGFFENSSGSLNSGYTGSGAVSLNALTNAPMGEHVTAGEEWSADIFSWCDLADDFDAYLTVFAHRL